MRSDCSRGSIRWVLLVSGWFCVSKTIIPEAGSTFSSLQRAATLILSVDWGVTKTVDRSTFRRATVLNTLLNVPGWTIGTYPALILCGSQALSCLPRGISAGHWATVASSLILPFAGEVPRGLYGHRSALAHVSDAKAPVVPLLAWKGEVCPLHAAGMSSWNHALAGALRDDGFVAVLHGMRRGRDSTDARTCQGTWRECRPRYMPPGYERLAHAVHCRQLRGQNGVVHRNRRRQRSRHGGGGADRLCPRFPTHAVDRCPSIERDRYCNSLRGCRALVQLHRTRSRAPCWSWLPLFPVWRGQDVKGGAKGLLRKSRKSR